MHQEHNVFSKCDLFLLYFVLQETTHTLWGSFLFWSPKISSMLKIYQLFLVQRRKGYRKVKIIITKSISLMHFVVFFWSFEKAFNETTNMQSIWTRLKSNQKFILRCGLLILESAHETIKLYYFLYNFCPIYKYDANSMLTINWHEF